MESTSIESSSQRTGSEISRSREASQRAEAREAERAAELREVASRRAAAKSDPSRGENIDTFA